MSPPWADMIKVKNHLQELFDQTEISTILCFEKLRSTLQMLSKSFIPTLLNMAHCELPHQENADPQNKMAPQCIIFAPP